MRNLKKVTNSRNSKSSRSNSKKKKKNQVLSYIHRQARKKGPKKRKEEKKWEWDKSRTLVPQSECEKNAHLNTFAHTILDLKQQHAREKTRLILFDQNDTPNFHILPNQFR